MSTCSATELHGNPFKYCPCGWMEDGAEAPDDSTVPAPATPKGEYGSPLHLLEEQRRTLEEVEALRRDLAVVVEFVNVLKGMGESLANAKGMQANMLRNMIPGLDQLGGQ